MSLLELFLLLAVLAAGAVLAWYVWLEKLLKSYHGDGSIALLRGWCLGTPDLALTLPLTAGERLYRLDGLPPGRIYSPLLVCNGPCVPGRLRLEARCDDRVVLVADSAAVGWHGSRPGAHRLGGQASLAVRSRGTWSLRCTWEPAESVPQAALVLTSRRPE